MYKGELKRKAVSGMIWTTINKFSKMGIQFISGVILARLLTPYDYGCIGMLAIFMALADAFIDGGFGSALIQKKRPSQKDYSTIFFWNVGLSIIMYLALFLSSDAIARFYDIPLLSDVLRVQGTVLFFYALMIVQKSQLRKQLKFKVISLIRIFSSIIALIVTIIMAYKGMGVWALVAQNMLGTVIPTIAYWAYTKWMPSWCFSGKSFKDLFNFGFFMFLTHIINTFSSQIQGLLIGRFYAPATLGFYTKAYRTESLASQTVTSVMTQVTYPLYAEVQDNKAVLGDMIKRLTSVIAYMTFPLLLLLILEAKPLFIFLYTDKWLQSVPYFQVLCVAGIIASIQSVNLQAIAAIGRSKTMFYWTLIKRGAGMSFILLGLFIYGMKGLLAGVVLFNLIAFFVNIGLVSKFIGYNWKKQILDILPIAVGALLALFISYLVGSLVNAGLYTKAIIEVLIYIFVYICWSVTFKPEAFIYTKSVYQMVLSKRHKH